MIARPIKYGGKPQLSLFGNAATNVIRRAQKAPRKALAKASAKAKGQNKGYGKTI
jgi:hypothetical protein